jgi:TPR repeat protein
MSVEDWYEKTEKAAQGNAKKDAQLADEHYERKEFKKAFELFKQAAEADDAYAQYSLAYLYANGEGIKKDHVQAAHWYTKAAEQGYAKAQRNLGFCYVEGEGVSQDYKKAVHWYSKAAQQGEVSSQYILGLAYYDGSGVGADKEKAVYWIRKAAEQGDEDAKTWLDTYESGQDTSGNDDEEDEVIYDIMEHSELQELIEKGDMYAMYQLGFNYILYIPDQKSHMSMKIDPRVHKNRSILPKY